jgi:CubicO group peptidase (beta-lactamase class C family)
VNPHHASRLLLIAALGAPLPAQSSRSAPAGDALARGLADYLARCEAHGFSGSVLVAKDGKVLLAKGVGLADEKTKEPNTEHTLFEIASATKQFTAAAILRLCELGKLEVEDPISEHLPGVPEHSAAITIHQLLTHTSGIPRANGKGRGDDLARAVRDYLDEGPKTKPGERFGYWNGGYALLAGIVERCSGQTFMQFCAEHLFEPAGMRDTVFTGDEAPKGRAAAVGTSGRGPSRGALEHPYGSFAWQYRGMGGAVTTVHDLFLWHRALSGDRVLSAASRKVLFEPALEKYACGWFVTRTDAGRTCHSHGGSVRGFVCDFRRYPEHDGCVVVLSNRDDFPPSAVSLNLERLLFGERLQYPEPPAVAEASAEELAAYCGNYRLPDGSRLVVRASGSALRLGAEGKDAVRMIAGAQAPPGFAADPDECAGRAVAIVEAVAKGDAKPLRQAMAPGIPADWPDRVRDRIWPAHAEKHGELESVRALGAVTRAGGVEIVLALTHARGESRVKIVFGAMGLQILDWNGPEFPATWVVRPVGGDEFVLFRWTATSSVKFSREDGKVTTLRVGERTAKRE